MSEHPEHSTPISSGVVGETAITSEPETIGLATGPHDSITGPFALRSKGASGTILASHYQNSRDSQASILSATTRTSSIAESVFSTSGLRCMSTYSNPMRLSSLRQDSADSEPVSAISPWETDGCKSGFDHGHRYFCTFCDNSFESKVAWRAHERDAHAEGSGYRCKDCGASYPALASLSFHLQAAHGSELFASALVPSQPLTERRVWACGFCSSLIYSQEDYLSHVEAHFDQGKEKVHWQQQSVVKALLHQPLVRSAWESVVSRQEALQGGKLRFCWDDQTSSTLQAMLECFVAHRDTPQTLAEFALLHANAKLERNVTGKCMQDAIISRPSQPEAPSLYPTLPISGRMSPHRHPSSPSAPQHLDGLPKISGLLTSPPHRVPFSSQAARKAMQLDDSAVRILGKIDETNSPPAHQSSRFPDLVDASGRHATTTRSLHSFESQLDLGASFAGPKRPLEPDSQMSRTSLATRPPSSAKRMIEDETVEFVQSPVSQLPRSPLGAHAACEEWLKVSKPRALPLRTTPSGSSLVSSWTAAKSLANSASDTVSEDSISEPDSWLGLTDQSDATKKWTRTFHHAVDVVMDRIWVSYNGEWDALATQCAGDQSGVPSQYAPSGTAQFSTMPHLTPSYGSRSIHSRQPSDERDDDDDVDRYRSSSSQSKRSSKPVKKYACPFRKHDPTHYNIRDHELCAVRAWDSVSRMKEHLYRKHCKVHCARCKQTFKRSAELELHERSEGCQMRHVRCPADITAQQEKQLKSKRYSTRFQTEEEKWREVYRLLFPGEDIPSPYPEVGEDLKPLAPDSRNTMDFLHFLLLEMPQTFRQTAEVHAGRRIEDHETLTMGSINSVITESINKAFQQWESTGHSVPRNLSPSSFVLESSVDTSPSLPIDTPIMSPFVSEPSTYATAAPPATMDGFWHPQDPATSYPLEMTGLPSHADNRAFSLEMNGLPSHGGNSGFSPEMTGLPSHGYNSEFPPGMTGVPSYGENAHFPLEMAGLPSHELASHGDGSGLLVQQSTFPPVANAYFQMPEGYGNGSWV
ncbi:hypothetical protein QBC39DRAFT_15227 [Podospora conica]|nr:hypothetical protein QBC39DRAFT_15227 [Schizothecium conicum]